MGDRYFLTVICPKCGISEDDVYYAPTCGFKTHICASCSYEIDLEEYTGISEEDCSNLAVLQQLVDSFSEIPPILPS